ncbi:M23 family metallopeptidase [Streptomyces cavernae]|uniref:M23 family metallopeptidase n=1 Tax=Streptomyces cavernae TaxID=2259034 RepID=UPI000FEBFDC6|nr:M23 family metallopeptidase [Streptomyces cavernae]
MASNRPGSATSFAPNDTQTAFVFGRQGDGDGETWEEWNPTAETVRPVRGRHRVAKQRGGGLARSSTILGVGVIAAVGGGGMASAQSGKAPVAISMPDLASMPGVGSLISDEDDEPKESEESTTPLTQVSVTTPETEQGNADAGEALRARIMAQAERQQDQADAAIQQAAEQAAVNKAAADAEALQKAEAEKAAAAKEKAEEEARQEAEAKRLAELSKSFSLPTSSYTITSTFGQSGALWSSGYHTGLDFAAPSGTPIKAVHSGTITQAGWSGSYGYLTVLTLEDGTEVWMAHQSSINVSVGQKVNTGDVIGRVGATGNVTGAHLHMEVHPGGASSGIDPMAWLRSKGLNP